MSSYCQLQLTCANKPEADRIAHTLLVKHLVACVKQILVSSDYTMQGKINHSEEILLIMESKQENFKKIEVEVRKLHSYDVFVLSANGYLKINKEAETWLSEELG